MRFMSGMQSGAVLDSNNFGLCLLVSLANLLNCPCCVLCNQWLRVGCRAFERRKVGWIAHIAERYAHIP